MPRADRAWNTLQPNEVIGGKYRLITKLGEGGMGVVWLALNESLHSEVALKLLARHIRHSMEGSERLLREAQAVAQLRHESIVRIFDVDVMPEGYPFLVMEHLIGEGLDEYLARQGPMNPRKAAQLLLPVCEAMSIAHSAGIIHRDLKPDNIFLARDGTGRATPKVLDFGLARLMTLAGSDRLTREGAMLGSMGYMPPEQLEGSLNTDERGDVWGLSVILYEMVLGRCPFLGEKPMETTAAIMAGTPPPLDDIADEPFRDIVLRGLKKSPDDRWASAAALGVALVNWLESVGVSEDWMGTSLQRYFPWSREHSPEARRSEPQTERPKSPLALRTAGTIVASGLALGLVGWLTWAALSLGDQPVPSTNPDNQVTTDPRPQSHQEPSEQTQVTATANGASANEEREANPLGAMPEPAPSGQPSTTRGPPAAKPPAVKRRVPAPTPAAIPSSPPEASGRAPDSPQQDLMAPY